MMSYVPPIFSDSFSMSAAMNRMLAAFLSAFRRATSSASHDMSIAVISADEIIDVSEMAMHPLPVPISIILGFGSLFSRTIQSTSSDVSGRGMRVFWFTSKCSPQKSVLPRIYCKGSPFCILFVNDSTFFTCISDNFVSLLISISARDKEAASPTSAKAICLTSEGEYKLPR